MSGVRPSAGTPVGTVGRVTLLAIAFILTAGFGIALLVSPDPRGFGTHQQLGLPPCTFRLLLGLPCPGCGMTTCFAHFVRGHFVDAFRVNAAGTVLAAVCMLMIPWSIWSAHRGRLCMVDDPVTVAAVLSVGIASLTVMVWLGRLISLV